MFAEILINLFQHFLLHLTELIWVKRNQLSQYPHTYAVTHMYYIHICMGGKTYSLLKIFIQHFFIQQKNILIYSSPP